MAAFFKNLRTMMQPGASVALVVGPSRTTLSGNEYVIDTPNLLGEVGRRCGYELSLNVPMDTYQRYDLHQRNSIGSETLTILKTVD
jgi:site-specific DNA-methyltransferase (cytosine-N4-specific)